MPAMGQKDSKKQGRKVEDKGVYCETVSPRNIRSYTPVLSLTWLPQCELNNYDIDEYAKLNGEKPLWTQINTKNYGQLRKIWGQEPAGKSTTVRYLVTSGQY